MSWNVSKDKLMTLVWGMVAAYTMFLVPSDALASVSVSLGGGGLGGGNADGGALGQVLCNVVDWFTGRIGQAVATLAILVIGIGALMGKVSWGMAIIVGIGVGVIFGAPSIVDALGGTGGC